MNQKEVLVKLINVGIVHMVGEEFFITDMYSELIDKSEAASDNFNAIAMTEFPDMARLYPDAIRLVKPDNRITAILDYCEVPLVGEVKGKSYMIRSSDATTRKVIDKIIHNKDIEPKFLLQGIKEYYSTSDYPKSFKRFVAEGDIHTMYELAKKGETLTGEGTQEDTTVWL